MFLFQFFSPPLPPYPSPPWNSSMMINNQRCAQPRRRIIRTDRANRRQGQSAFAVRREKKNPRLSFSERVLAEERERRLITDCSPRSEFFHQCLNSKSRKRSEWERRRNIINKRKTPFHLCRRSQRVSNGCLSRRLTLYSRTMPLWLLWGGGSQDTLILELLVSCTTDTACGGALKTGDGDKGRKLYFPLEFLNPTSGFLFLQVVKCRANLLTMSTDVFLETTL